MTKLYKTAILLLVIIALGITTASAVSAVTLRTVTIDAETKLDINPSEVTVDGVIKTANPYAYFNVPTNTVLLLTNKAPGYITDSDQVYIDPRISLFTDVEFTLVAETANEIFETKCVFNVNFQTYECDVTNNGHTNKLYYNPLYDRYTVGNYLVQKIIPNVNPVVSSFVATPLSGEAPLPVTFTVHAQDVDGVIDTVRIVYGDESFDEITPRTSAVSYTFTHIYTNPDSYRPTVYVWDNKGGPDFKHLDISVRKAQIILPNTPPVAEAGPHQTVRVGDVVTLDASASVDIDGDTLQYNWQQQYFDGPAVQLQNARSVRASFVPTLPGRYDFFVVVSDERKGNIDTVSITVIDQVRTNRAPIANAGADIFTTLPDTILVALDGSASSDPDDDELTYSWVQTAGPIRNLLGATTVRPTFIPFIPVGQTAAQFTYQLTVSDGVDSAIDSVNIFVRQQPVNGVPTAHAGNDFTVEVNRLGILDGSLSSDPEGSPLNYRWSQISGPVLVSIQNHRSAVATVSAPVAGNYEFQLFVDDNVAGDDDTVIMHVIPVQIQNQAPVARAGVDRRLPISFRHRLNGTASFDPEGFPLTYSWAKIGGPTAYIADTTTATPEIILSVPGIYTYRLTVSDGSLNGFDDVVITAYRNTAPTANAGGDQTVTVDTSVILRGVGNDIDNDPLTYEWQQLAGTPVALNNARSATATFTAPSQPGILTFLLKVGDGYVISTDIINIDVRNFNNAPIAKAGKDQVVGPSEILILDGRESTDSDGFIIEFRWAIITAPVGSQSSVDLLGGFTQFIADISGNYTVRLIVTDNQGATATDDVVVVVNARPIVSAGPDKTGTVGVVTTFQGTASDPEGSPLLIGWTQQSGPEVVTIINSNQLNAHFTPTLPGIYVFEVFGSDEYRTSTDTVTITVGLANQPPIARAGDDRIIGQNVYTTLDGSASSDSDGGIVSYQWTMVRSPGIGTFELQSPTTAVAQLRSDFPGQYEVRLTVTDSSGVTATDDVDIYINARPVVSPVGITPGALNVVNTFIASVVDSDDAFPSVLWSQLQGPMVTITNPTTIGATFIPTVPGQYIFQLAVSDGVNAPVFQTVFLTLVAPPPAINIPPVANAGPDRSTEFNSYIVLDASSSFDPDGFIVEYRWQGSGFDIISDNPFFPIVSAGTVGSLVKPGSQTLILSVKDNSGAVATDSVIITVGQDTTRDSDVFRSPREQLRIESINFNSFGDVVIPGQTLLTSVRTENNAGKELKDVSIAVTLPQLGLIRRVGPFKLERGEGLTKSLPIVLPDSIVPGLYLVRIVISSDDVRRVETRFIRIG